MACRRVGGSDVSKVSHAETGRVRGDSRLADFARSHVSGLAVHRSRAADEPDVGRRRLQLRGAVARLARSRRGARLPHLHGCRRLCVSARRRRLPLRSARLSASRHSPSHPVT